MIKFTKNSGLVIQNQTAFPPDQKVIIKRDNLFDKWQDVIIKANLSKKINGSFKIWVNGKKQFDYKGISRQSTAVRDPIDLGIYNTGSMFGKQNNDGKDLGFMFDSTSNLIYVEDPITFTKVTSIIDSLSDDFYSYIDLSDYDTTITEICEPDPIVISADSVRIDCKAFKDTLIFFLFS